MIDRHGVGTIRSVTLPDGRTLACPSPGEAMVVWREVVADGCYRAAIDRLGARPTIIDVGAYIGITTLHMLSARPDARAIAIEPAAATYECLRINCGEYAPRAVPLRSAVGDAPARRSFTFYPRAPAQSGLYANPQRDARLTRSFLTAQGMEPDVIDELLDGLHEPRPQTVEVTTVSAVMGELALARVDLLKVDVEGAELDVLAGVASGDWPLIGQVVMEVHGGPDHRSLVVGRLAGAGFQVTVDNVPLLAHPELCLIFGVRNRGR